MKVADQPVIIPGMRQHLVADGARRLLECEGHLARLQELRQAIEQRHAAALQEASGWVRWRIRRRIASEFRHERKRIEPSPWACHAAR